MGRKLSAALFLVALVGFNYGTPLTHLGVPTFPAWRMFRDYRSDMCFVHFTHGGERIDRYRVLGYEDRARAPLKIRRVRNVKQATAIGRLLCKELGIGKEIRAELTCGHVDGWRKVEVPGFCGRWRQ